jgi:hypothetical protein
VINVVDVDDMKPYFILHQHIQEIKENTPIGSQVAMVKAKDGDKGIDAEINYAIVAGMIFNDVEAKFSKKNFPPGDDYVCDTIYSDSDSFMRKLTLLTAVHPFYE